MILDFNVNEFRETWENMNDEERISYLVENKDTLPTFRFFIDEPADTVFVSFVERDGMVGSENLHFEDNVLFAVLEYLGLSVDFI